MERTGLYQLFQSLCFIRVECPNFHTQQKWLSGSSLRLWDVVCYLGWFTGLHRSARWCFWLRHNTFCECRIRREQKRKQNVATLMYFLKLCFLNDEQSMLRAAGYWSVLSCSLKQQVRKDFDSPLQRGWVKSAGKEGDSALLSDGESTGEGFSSSAGATTNCGESSYRWVAQKHARREGGEKLELL